MGKTTGFLEFERKTSQAEAPLDRIKHYDEFHTPLTREEQAEQGARCMECGVPFCQFGKPINGMISGCPLNNLIPEWNDLVYRGNYAAAYERLVRTNPFPEFTSRVCPALCEKACTCSIDSQSVSVRENEYAIIENAFEEGIVKPAASIPRTGKKIAVIGSGPAGLAAAERLNSRGHHVAVIERDDKPGGLLRYGIPNMKLEKQIIDRRIDIMKADGVEFLTDCAIKTKHQAEKIKNEFDAVVLACGASNPRDISAPGRDAKGIYFAVDFLKATTKALYNGTLDDESTYISAKDKNVIVIGGGDTGNDCVGTSVRHGAKSVIQLEMMPKPPEKRRENNPWPEWPLVCKTDYGQEEAAALYGSDPRRYETTVKEFVKDETGSLCAVITVKLERVLNEETGRYVMNPIPGSEERLDAQLVLIAAGFLGSQKEVTDAFSVETDARSNVVCESGTHKTSQEKVFTAGDMHLGQSLVVRAIREGRDAAKEVDEFLMGYSNLI